jgi:hypothetical protein
MIATFGGRDASSGNDYLRPILPRSRHLPRASSDGNRIENFNEIGVRLWTNRS